MRPDNVDIVAIIKARAERYLAKPPPDVAGIQAKRSRASCGFGIERPWS